MRKLIVNGLFSALLAAAVGAAAPVAPARAAGGWRALSPAPLERLEVSSARVGRYVYVLGGLQGGQLESSTAFERYDVLTDSWKPLPPVPEAVNHAVAVAYHGDVYVLGGFDGQPITLPAGDPLSPITTGEVPSFYRYDPRAGTWWRMPSMPTRRGALAAGVIGHKLYAAGGVNNGERELARLEVYDFRSHTWSRGPDMGVPREHVAGVVQGGRFYTLGGRDRFQRNLSAAERFDPKRGRWERLPDLPEPRSAGSAVPVCGAIVLFGGEELVGPHATTTISEVDFFDPRSSSWQSLPSMLTPRHGMGATSYGPRVFGIDGGPKPGATSYSNLVEALDVPVRGSAGRRGSRARRPACVPAVP
jgi:N-acetylneuraminic acid mutarotase